MIHTKRNILSILAVTLAMLLFAACAAPAIPQATIVPTLAATEPPADTPTVTVEPPTPAPTDTPISTVSLTPTSTVSPTPTASPTPKGPTMYSSYADLISFDPETGIAKFDYFDMLRGNDAVKFLVDHEGYTQAAAEAMVQDFADSEYVKKNTNPQLRAIDIDDVSLKLMYKPNGDPVADSISVSVTPAQFRSIYMLNTSLLLETYFYYIHVESDGSVSLVEQVYWP